MIPIHESHVMKTSKSMFYDQVCINCGSTNFPLSTLNVLDSPCIAEIKYNKEPDDFGNIMTVEKWLDDCDDGYLIDYDGFCQPMKEGKVCDLFILPSERNTLLPKDATHVIWYNK